MVSVQVSKVSFVLDGEHVAFGRVIQGTDTFFATDGGAGTYIQWEAEEEGCHRRHRRDTKAPMG